MINTRMKPIKSKVIDVYYDKSCGCGTDSEDILKSGLKIVSALIDLELKGYRVNLSVLYSSFDDGEGDIMCVKVKDARQPFALQRMMFPIVHTGFFRSIGFDWYERCPTSTYRCGYGRGIGHDDVFKKKRKDYVKTMFSEHAVLFSVAEILEEDEKYIEQVITNGYGKD